MRQTSLEAYKDIEIGNQSKKIIDFLKTTNGNTRHEISRFTKIPINAVCGRVNEMLKKGIIIEDGKREDMFTNKVSNILKC